MKRNLLLASLFLFISIQLIFYSCANVGSPTGGPKDTIPPKLIKIYPSPNATQYKDKVIRMEFNEPIQIKDFQRQVIITPRTTVKYKTKVNKNMLEIEFEKNFDDSTTYTFNFREGIADLNEGNVVKDLSLAFSTGTFIDSLTIGGKVKYLMTAEPAKDVLVSLYSSKDTLNIFNEAPVYLSKTNAQGQYSFSNLKPGKYYIYAIQDKNNNLKAETKDEYFGFFKDEIILTDNVDSLNINLIRVNADEPKINNSRASGQYYEINLNKSVASYKLEALTKEADLISNLVEDNKKVRVYKTETIKDSVQASFIAFDSLYQQVADTMWIKFTESKRGKADFKTSVQPKAGSQIEEDFEAVINFTKPVTNIKPDSAYFIYDSLNLVPINPETDFTWNDRRDKLTIKKKLNAKKELVKAQTNTNTQSTEKNQKAAAASSNLTIQMYLNKGMFISVEGDSSEVISAQYRFLDPKDFGVIAGKVQSNVSNFIIQLINANNNQVVQERINQREYVFRNVPPGDYKLRIFIDENGNGKWDPGNIHKREEAEPVVIYDKQIVVKANWELRDTVISF